MATTSPQGQDLTSPSNGSETSSTFKSFWKKSDSKKNVSPTQTDVTFVQQDPSTEKKSGNRLSRLLKRGSKSSTNEGSNDGSSGKAEAQKRRQQVYQAQKRHRNRKAEYVKSLEEELAKLQHLDSVINSEKNSLAFQNQQMKDLLASHSLDFKLETTTLEPSKTKDLDPGSAAVEIRHDAQIGHDRTFVDWSEFSGMDWMTTSESSNVEASRTASASVSHSATPPAPKLPAKGDTWAAVDFILALEWPCQGHIHHHGINPEAAKCGDESGHGHAFTATATVYEYALPPTGEGNGQTLQVPEARSSSKWQLPHAEIDKLIQMSENLPIDDISITPAQAYSAIKEAVPSNEQLRSCLDSMKGSLSGLVQCQGFGSVMPADGFWKELDKMIEQFEDVEQK